MSLRREHNYLARVNSLNYLCTQVNDCTDRILVTIIDKVYCCFLKKDDFFKNDKIKAALDDLSTYFIQIIQLAKERENIFEYITEQRFEKLEKAANKLFNESFEISDKDEDEEPKSDILARIFNNTAVCAAVAGAGAAVAFSYPFWLGLAIASSIAYVGDKLIEGCKSKDKAFENVDLLIALSTIEE